jgi:DNA-binding PadR family transcriptional regulator
MSNRLPDITHLQFLVLEALDAGDQAGRDLRRLLEAHGVKNSAPAFYQMMSRLETAGFVAGRYDQKVVAGQHLKERRYEVTRAGRRAVRETRHFYLARESAAGRPVRKGSHA